MKLTIKTLQNTTFKVDVELDKTVKDLKEIIEEKQGKDYSCASQKLIYSGKILTDDSKLSDYEFDEKKFLVLMTTRPPPPQKPAAPSSSATGTSSKETGSIASTDQGNSSSNDQSVSTSDVKPTNASASANNKKTTTTQAQPSVPQSQQEPIPPSATDASSRAAAFAAAARATSAAAAPELSALSMGDPQMAARLASIMSQSHFRRVQDLIQQSPHLVSSAIESLATADPDMYNFISENPDIFVNALNHPPLAGSRSHENSAQQQRQAMRAGGMSQQPMVDQLVGGITEQDKEAIERLKELGFSEILAIQAYMACDKDEQLAANLLFQMDQ